MTTVELYSSAACGYCVAAKNLLKQKGFDYEEIRIDLDPARLVEMLSRTGGRRSVPQVFVNGNHVGGFEELVAAERNGKLAEFAENGKA
jgi:glutaredoxin 3